MPELATETLRQIEKDFRIDGLYKLKKDEDVFCIHVNSVVNIGLAELGYADLAANNLDRTIDSRLYSKNERLFYREINDKNEIVNRHFNTCKNALAVLALIATNNKPLAEKTISSLYHSPLYNPKTGLFHREFDPTDKALNPLIITQTNLWLTIALIKLQKIDLARKTIQALELLNFDNRENLFISQDCKPRSNSNKKQVFSDDQALAIIAYKLLGHRDQAENLLNKVFASRLYDSETGLFNRNFNSTSLDKTKTSYKNGLMGVALGMMDYGDELDKLNGSMFKLLYDHKELLFNFSDSDPTKIPDTSILALLAENFCNLKHIIF